ncbi:MAG: hypothetical protein HXS50_00055 [Theionarchaea archaeon]|nr:hypothetical protein [Theionarchaea archaeon]
MVLFSTTSLARDLRSDPVTGRVRVIYMGKIVGSPFPVLSQEPLLSPTAVYACTVTQDIGTIQRSVRNYMPRTYSRFLANDVVILCDANKQAFRSDHFRWMKDGVLEDGQGLAMIGGAESFADIGGYPSWKPTEVAEILPCEMMELGLTHSGGTIRILDPDDEFARSLPLDRIGAFGYFSSSNYIEPRTRAHLIAQLVKPMQTSPFLMWWDIGEGRTLAMSAGWQPVAGNIFMRWDYYGDYAINMMLFLAGQKLPDDLELVYLVRRRMREINEGLSTIYSMVEMVEKFGGSAQSLNGMIIDLQNQREEGRSFYFQADMDGALQAFALAQEKLDDLMDETIRARNSAALWIFVTEWAAVTGTALLTGVAVWFLMVKRSLYHEVEITRLKPNE